MPSIKPTELNHIIRNRRSVFPRQYIDRAIPESIIQELLENANWAPNHKLTEPWRFKVLQDEAKDRFAHYLAETYKSITPEKEFKPLKYEKIGEKIDRSAALITIYMKRDPMERLPEWEEMAAVAMAVQNIWLACSAYNIGCYWSTTSLKDHVDGFFEPEEGETCLGFLYMGYYEGEPSPSRRKPWQEKVEWLK